MGKGNRNRKQRDRKPPTTVRAVTGMAADIPMPTLRPDLPKSDSKQHRYWTRVVEHQLHGVQLLWNYVAFVDQGGFNVPSEHFGPRRDDEPDEQYQQRVAAARALKEVQAAAGTWAELATDEIGHIRPSDAGGVAMWIIGQGHDWCRESGFDATANDYRDGASPLLDALCPAEHRQRAAEVLNMFWEEIVFHRPPSIEETATRYPIATLHVAAAMTGGLFANPACVPDRTATQMKLAEFNKKIVNALYPGSRA